MARAHQRQVTLDIFRLILTKTLESSKLPTLPHFIGCSSLMTTPFQTRFGRVLKELDSILENNRRIFVLVTVGFEQTERNKLNHRVQYMLSTLLASEVTATALDCSSSSR